METVWLRPSQFAVIFCRTKRAIDNWCANGFCVELGFVVHHKGNSRWMIGVPPTHDTYEEARRILSR